MKRLLEILKNFLERNGTLKLITSIVLLILLLIFFDVTQLKVFLWLLLIPAIYIVPFFMSSFIFAWIIFPIKWIINKFKKK